MSLERVIFEKGITVYKNLDSHWLLEQKSKGQKNYFANFGEIQEIFKVRPIVGYEIITKGDKIGLIIDITGKKSLDLQLIELIQVREISHGSDYIRISNLQYSLSAVLYHLRHLGEIYSKLCFDVSSTCLLMEDNADQLVYSSNFVDEAYYEVDAILSDIMRFYETLKYLIWIKFTTNTSVPRSYESVLSKITKYSPYEFNQELIENWDKYGKEIKAYRDCIQHNSPIIFGIPSARMSKFKYEVWGANILLPDNPSAKSRSSFTFEKFRDSLSYCWKIVDQSVQLVLRVLNTNH